MMYNQIVESIFFFISVLVHILTFSLHISDFNLFAHNRNGVILVHIIRNVIIGNNINTQFYHWRCLHIF